MPNFETIKKYARCWSEAKLREAAKLWPDPLTWEWFLGERCEAKDRAECLDILSVAVAHAQRERIPLPLPLREVWQARATAAPAALLDAMLALGIYFDRWDAGGREGEYRSEEYVQLADALGALTGRSSTHVLDVPRDAAPVSED